MKIINVLLYTIISIISCKDSEAKKSEIKPLQYKETSAPDFFQVN
jgi:hypothetical protein